jgi:hypothetical protein
MLRPFRRRLKRTYFCPAKKKGAHAGPLCKLEDFINRRQRKERKRRLRTSPLNWARFTITSKMAINSLVCSYKKGCHRGDE